jgi:hypothetical protein
MYADESAQPAAARRTLARALPTEHDGDDFPKNHRGHGTLRLARVAALRAVLVAGLELVVLALRHLVVLVQGDLRGHQPPLEVAAPAPRLGQRVGRRREQIAVLDRVLGLLLDGRAHGVDGARQRRRRARGLLPLAEPLRGRDGRRRRRARVAAPQSDVDLLVGLRLELVVVAGAREARRGPVPELAPLGRARAAGGDVVAAGPGRLRVGLAGEGEAALLLVGEAEVRQRVDLVLAAALRVRYGQRLVVLRRLRKVLGVQGLLALGVVVDAAGDRGVAELALARVRDLLGLVGAVGFELPRAIRGRERFGEARRLVEARRHVEVEPAREHGLVLRHRSQRAVVDRRRLAVGLALLRRELAARVALEQRVDDAVALLEQDLGPRVQRRRGGDGDGLLLLDLVADGLLAVVVRVVVAVADGVPLAVVERRHRCLLRRARCLSLRRRRLCTRAALRALRVASSTARAGEVHGCGNIFRNFSEAE